MHTQIKKSIAILLLPFMLQIAVSCRKDPGPVHRQYTNKAIQADNIDNSGKEPMVTYTNTVIKKAYGIRIKLFRDKLVHHPAQTSFFIQAAYAYSNRSNDVIFSPIETIVSIKITTLNNFDSGHPANTDVTNYFSAFNNNKFYAVNNYLNFLNNSLYNNEVFEPVTDFLLMSAPAPGSMPHKFKIQFILSNNKILEATTTQIDLI